MTDVKIEKPTMAQIMNNAIEKRLFDLHVSLPASIEKYDGVKADVRPLLKRKMRDGTEFELPVITNVPVIWPATADAEIVLPLAAGDTGMLIFAERSLDIWLVQGGSVSPDDFRKFNLSDAQFVPGLRPFNKETAYDPDRLVMRHGDARVTLKADGKLKIENAAEELLDLIDQLLQALLDARTNTLLGPQPLVPPTLFSDIKTKLATLKE